MDEDLKQSFFGIPKENRNKAIAMAFLLELELSRGSKNEKENMGLFLDYANCVEGEQDE